MEIQISNPFLDGIVVLLSIWGILCMIALLLISLRRDKEFVYEDINKLFLKPSLYLQILSVIMLYFILPISIPYSIAHIFKK